MSAPTAQRPPAPPRRRGPLLVLLPVAGLLLAGAVVLAVLGLDGPLTGRPAGHPSPSNVVQGPVSPTISITASNGRRLACPQGAAPTINISNAFFTPTLRGGTSFGRGRYTIELTGVVANESTGAIVIDRIDPWVLGAAWRGATVRGPVRLAPESSGRLVIRGGYVSGRPGRAAAGANLHWHWARSDLSACGDRGLIEDS